MKINQFFERMWQDAKRDRKKMILHFLPKGKDLKLLDCGCDDGTFTKELAKKLNTKKIYGIEINDQVIKDAKKKGILVKKADLNMKFPFENKVFDVVVADQVIEHLWNLDNFLLEIKRVLRDDGYAIISTENLASWHNVAALLLGLQPFTGPTPSSMFVVGFHPLTPSTKVMRQKHTSTVNMPPHTKVLTYTAFRDLCLQHGFTIEEAQTYGYLPFPSFLSHYLVKLDPRHSLFMTLKLKNS